MKNTIIQSCVIALCISLPIMPAKVASAPIPYLAEISKLSLLNPTQKTSLTKAWQSLHDLCQSQNSTNPPTITPAQINGIKPLLTTNYFDLLAQYCTSTKMLSSLSTPIEKNYSSTHLVKTAQRLASVSHISFEKNTPQLNFNGDIRDFGIIVNIKNNTQSDFAIYQSTTDGKKQTEIGQLNPGINAVNLHTAALQNPKTTNTATSSAYMFDFYELNVENPTYISIRIYTGIELIQFLQDLPRPNKNTISMNGLPTSPEYLANPQDWYMVLIQNPTEPDQAQPNFDQRIQAINISKFDGPYLLKMQINPSTIELTEETEKNTIDIFQPSLSDAFIPKNQYTTLTTCPFIFLKQNFWKNQELKTLWHLLYTTHLSVLTSYKLVGINSFGKAFDYFDQLGFFNITNEYSFFIDHYNSLRIGYQLYNASWLISAGLYETNLATCSDIPTIYAAQDMFGHMIANGTNYYDTTFLTIFEPQNPTFASESTLNNQDINSIYALSKYQLYSIITNASNTDIKQAIFGQLTKINEKTYKLSWTNKKKKILQSQYLYLDSPITNITITFVNKDNNWTGTSIPTNLLPQENNQTTEFKVSYEYSATNNKHILLTQPTSPIDKQETILPLYFSKYPIDELYIDLFHQFNINPYTRCHIIKKNLLPDLLNTLIEQDWKNGIYMIPKIANNHLLSEKSPGVLELVFYKYDKTMLGTLTLSGQYNDSNETGIKQPISCYNPCFSPTHCLTDMYLSTGILLRYIQ